MPFQITSEAFKWLQGLSLVKEAKRNQNGMMEVTEETLTKLIDGFAVGALLKTILKSKADEDKVKKLESLKEHSTPAIRLYNWGILTDVLKQVGYNLQYGEKSKLTNMDPEPLTRLLPFLCELRAKDPSLKVQDSNALKVQINQIGKKGPKEATNALEFLTILISKHFKISPQQTLNLFLDNNKYLSHLLAKGVKNSFEPIYALLAEIKAHIEFVVLRLFCLDEEQNVGFLLNGLRTCLIGKEEQAAVVFCEMLMQIYHQYRLGGLNLQVLRNWVKNEGINTLFFAIKKQPLLTAPIIEICYSYLDDEFFQYIQLSEKSILWSTDREKLIFYKNFAEESPAGVLEKFAVTGYFEEWNRMLVKSMKRSKDSYEMTLLMAIMEVQWDKLGSRFEQHDLTLANQLLNFLKNALAADTELLFVQACRTLFTLMQSLGATKNPFAPLIYKILVTAYSTISDSARIAFISDNFTVSFKGIGGLPGSSLVQPLLKHIEKNLDYSIISLSQTLIEERRISDDESLDLIEMFTKVLFQDIRFGEIILGAIFEGLPSISADITSSYLENNCKLCLSQLYSNSKAITKTIKALKLELATHQDTEGKSKANENFIALASKHVLCKNLVGFIAKAIFQDSQMKRELEAAIFTTYIKIKQQLKKTEQAELLRPLMLTYHEEEELEDRISYYHNKLYPPKPKVEPEKSHSHTIEEHDHLSKSLSVRPSSAHEEDKLTAVILDPSLLKPSSFALKDLQKARQKRYEQKTIEQQKERERAMKAERVEKFRTIQQEKRLIESMATIKNDVEYNHLQTIDNREMSETIDLSASGVKDKDKEKQREGNVGSIRLVSLEREEEDTYREDAESVMRKYRKVWRYLFYKYSSKKEGSSEEKAHLGEAWKMLRDYEFAFLRKEEVFTIARLVNQNLKRKNDIQFLTYPAFEDFILQSAIIGYSRQGYSHIPPGQQLLLFIEQLKRVTKEKSGSVEIFQNPEEAYFQETEVIREFNKRLRENPDYILPEGYKRTKQTTLEYQYEFHPMLQKNVSPSYIDVLEVLDSIFFKHPSLGFHLVQPLTIKSQVFLAKPALFQSISQKMKDYSKGYLNPKRSISASNDKDASALPPLPSPPAKKDFKPYINFSLGVKLGIAQTSLKDKSIAEEVAYCMEDILSAVESQSPVVRKGNRKKIVNEFMRRKKTEMAKVETERKRDEVNWKKRAESVKLEVEALREKRKQSEKAKKKREAEERRAKREREERAHKERVSEFEKVKAKMAEKKEALLQLKSMEEEKVRREKEEYKAGVEEYFRKKKEEIREKEEEYKRRKAEERERREEGEQRSREFTKKLYLSNLKREEQVLEKIEEMKEGYEEAWKAEPVQKVFGEKRQCLRLLFQLLLKYEKSKISATSYDEIGVATLNYFCLKFQIVPFLLHKQDVSKIYTYALKDAQDAKRKGINQDKFEEVLFLISVKAKKTLNRLVEKRKRRERRMQAFLNAQKSQGGNHFETKEVEESSSEEEEEEEKPTLQDQYLFNAEDVSEETVEQIFTFLKLPGDKLGMEERYREAMESKNSKPRSQVVREMRESLEEG